MKNCVEKGDRMFRYMLLSLTLVIIISIATVSAPIRWWGGGITWFQYPVTPWIAGSYPEIVVVDPDYGPNDEPWTSNDIERLKASGAKVIAYLNIGFAEEWRDYWNESWSETDHPEWLEWVEYPGWPGEYFVKYWHPSAWEPSAWVDILKNELDKIISMGFDGVRFDNIDSYTYWEDPDSIGLGDVLPQVENASTWMIYLVGNLSAYAHSLDPDFIVIANMGGGLELLENESFMNAIDGVEREEVWYSDDQPVDPAETSEVLYYLEMARDQGKTVYVLDYAWTRSNVEDALAKARDEGFYIYVAPNYDLDRLAAYIPSYHGVDSVATADSLIVAWSYHGPVEDVWRDEFDVYIGRYVSGGMEDVVRISSSGAIDERPSIAYDGSSNRILVVYETNEATGDYRWVKGVIIDPTTLSIIMNITIARDDTGASDQYMASASAYNGYFYVFYVNTTEDNIYYAKIDPSTGSMETRGVLEDTVDPDYYPVSTTTSSGVAVLWYSNGELRLAHVSGSGVDWIVSVDTGVEYQRYGLAYVPGEGILVIYQKGSGCAKLYDLNGSELASKTGLPDVTWMPGVGYIGSGTVAYVGLNSIHYLGIGSIVYSGSTGIDRTPTTGSSIAYYNGDAIVFIPSTSGNNTIDALAVSLPQPIPEPPASILLVAIIILVIMLRRILMKR